MVYQELLKMGRSQGSSKGTLPIAVQGQRPAGMFSSC